MTPSVVGARLREARRYVRLSQTAVAAFMGTTRQSVAAFEKGTRSPDLVQLVRAGNLFRMTLQELVADHGPARTAAAPAFRPRFNRQGTLTDADAAELAGFEEFLQSRILPEHALHFTAKGPRTIGEAIARLYSRTGIERSAPVPVLGLLARCGVEVRFTALEQLAGALVISPDLTKRPHGVLINSDQPHDRQRFSAAHELGHLVLAHDAEGRKFIDLMGRHFNPVELQADQFASELLMPVEMLRERHRELAAEPATHLVLKLSRTFSVSFQAMGTRLTTLGLLAGADTEKVKKAKPSDVAAAVGPHPRGGKRVPFNARDMRSIADTYLTSGWEMNIGQKTVRLLQESAYSHYMSRVPEGLASDSAGHVYELVARWVAETFPLIASR